MIKTDGLNDHTLFGADVFENEPRAYGDAKHVEYWQTADVDFRWSSRRDVKMANATSPVKLIDVRRLGAAASPQAAPPATIDND